MASYTISQNSAGTQLTWTVTGLTAGDQVVFFIRYEPNDNNAGLQQIGPRAATDSTMTQSCTIEPGQYYVTRVSVNDVPLAAQYFTANDPAGSRPEDWSWSGIIWSGCPLENLTAAAWNRFTARVNEFRTYAGNGAYSFTQAVSGQTPLVTLFSEAEAAIRGTTGHGTVPTGRELSMTYFDGLASALNAVP